jgi:Xaa-Pro aminopeptidase
VYKAAHKLYVPGNTINKINAEVNKMMEAKMIDLGLFTKEDVEQQDKMNPLYTKYFMHGTAHFIGLDVHDVGSKDTVFETGMVLTCEPGLYIEDEGIGIRIETDIVVGKEPIDLMKEFPVEIKEIEDLMR